MILLWTLFVSITIVDVRGQNSIACGPNQPEVLTSKTGSLFSPRFGHGGYSEENSCSWIIEPNHDLVCIQFQNLSYNP